MKICSSQFDWFEVDVSLDDDGDWLSYFVELDYILAFGETEEKSLHELYVAWEAYKESCRKHGEPVPVSDLGKKMEVKLFNCSK